MCPLCKKNEVKSKFEEIREVKKSTRRCTSQRSWICVIPKKPELDKTFQKLQGTCGAEGTVRDDSGNCAVFTRQGSCITYDGSKQSQTLLQDCLEGHNKRAALRVRTRNKKKGDSLELLRLPEADCPMLWIRLSRSRRPKSWDSTEGPVVPSERNFYGQLSAVLL